MSVDALGTSYCFKGLTHRAAQRVPGMSSGLVDFWCFNATFNNISAISWRPILVVEEARVPGENHRPWPSNW